MLEIQSSLYTILCAVNPELNLLPPDEVKPELDDLAEYWPLYESIIKYCTDRGWFFASEHYRDEDGQVIVQCEIRQPMPQMVEGEDYHLSAWTDSTSATVAALSILVRVATGYWEALGREIDGDA